MFYTYLAGSDDVTCYDDSVTDNGWCKANGSEKWGFCMRSCEFRPGLMEDGLEEADFKTVPDCGGGSVDADSEMCVVGRFFYPEVANFVRVGGKIFREERRLPETREGVLGFRDSCQGDSGSPVWRWDAAGRDGSKIEAVLVGVISRGGIGCAGRESVAVVTRIVHHLGWIRRMAGMMPGELIVLLYALVS